MNNEPFLEFEDYPSTDTPLSATNLNNMQISIADSISTNSDNIGDLTTLTTTDKTDLVSAVNELNSKSIITAYFTSDYTLSATSTYLKLPLNASLSVGTKLTLDTTNNTIVVGTGVSMIKISAKVSYGSVQSSGVKWLTIFRTRSGVDGTVASNPNTLSARGMIYCTDTLVDAQEGDIIYLAVYGTSGDKIRSNAEYTNITIETVG